MILSERPRSLIATFVFVGLVLASTGCKGGGSSLVSGSGPVFTKPFDQLTKEDIGGACAKLGWENSGVTNSSGGGMSNIIASCTKESEEGSPSPDGKKRLRMGIGAYKLTSPMSVNSVKSDCAGATKACEWQGDNALTVSINGKPKEEMEKVLKVLLGK